MNYLDKNSIDEAYKLLLNRLPKALADKVESLYLEDEENFYSLVHEASKEITPTTWIKTSCKHCYGRGTIGINAQTNQPIECSCIQKTYFKWLKTFRQQYLERTENAS